MVDARRLSFTTRKISYRYWSNPCDNSRGVGAASEGEPHKNFTLKSEQRVMNKQKLKYFRNLLLEQRRQAIEDLRADRATALEGNDGVEDAGEMSEFDLNQSTALTLASRQSQLLEEIDEALGRIEDGTYGQCSRCGKPLDEERLKAMPTAKYDAECQAAIEAAQGIATPTL
jgi:DnaK suppressor protein